MKLIPILLVLYLCLISASMAESITPTIKVFHSPDCHCCKKWIAHLKANQFDVIDIPSYDMASIKENINLPTAMTSCHTAIVDGYVIEGHVPANDIKQLLNLKPNITGLAVPKMPVGSPGMEIGKTKSPFIVFQFDSSGHYVPFNEYQIDQLNQYQSKPAP